VEAILLVIGLGDSSSPGCLDLPEGSTCAFFFFLCSWVWFALPRFVASCCCSIGTATLDSDGFFVLGPPGQKAGVGVWTFFHHRSQAASYPESDKQAIPNGIWSKRVCASNGLESPRYGTGQFLASICQNTGNKRLALPVKNEYTPTVNSLGL